MDEIMFNSVAGKALISKIVQKFLRKKLDSDDLEIVVNNFDLHSDTDTAKTNIHLSVSIEMDRNSFVKKMIEIFS